jgi:hypothetical protein
VVRYRHVADGLADLCASVAAGDGGRRWAWRRLGWWPTTGAVRPGEVVAAALAGRPAAAVAALAALARRGRLAAVLAAVAPADLAAVAEAAAFAVAGPRPLAALGGAAPGAVGADRVGGAAHARAAALLARSELGGPLAAWLAAVAGGAPAAVAARSAAVLVVAEVEPALLVAPGAPGGGTPVDGVAAALASAAAVDGAGPAAAGAGERAPALAGADDPAAGPDERPAGRPTVWGGLPFLLHVAADLDLAGRVAADPRLAGLGLRATLHRAGVALTGAAPDDPGVLALAGCDRPELAAPEAADAAGVPAAVDGVAADLLAGAWARLGDRAPDLAGAAERVRWLCGRRAVVVADPGWVEVRLLADEVVVEVRVAGLDLDPGWVPELGCVVRFTYEGEVHRA